MSSNKKRKKTNKKIKKPYECNECDKSFSGASGLWYHKKHVHNAITQLRPRNNSDSIGSCISKEPKLKKPKLKKPKLSEKKLNQSKLKKEIDNFLSTIIKYSKSDNINPFTIEWGGKPDGLMRIVDCYHTNTNSLC